MSLEIIYKDKNEKVEFSTLQPRDMFESSGSIYIKTEHNPLVELSQGHNYGYFNCFNLRTLQCGKYSRETLITPVQGKLTVNKI